MTTVESIPTEQVTAGDNDRTRFGADDIDRLAATIEAHGLLQPITVRPHDGGYQIVAGERRFRAVTSLGWTTIPAIVRQYDDRAASDAMLVENTGRVDLDPLDEAAAYAKRMAEGMDAAEVAETAGVSVVRVRFRVKLLDLVPDAQALVRRGDLSLGMAQSMHGLDRNRQQMALRALGRSDLSAMAFRDLVARLRDDQHAEGQEALDFDMVVEEAEAAEEKAKARTTRATLIAALRATVEALPEDSPARETATAALAAA